MYPITSNQRRHNQYFISHLCKGVPPLPSLSRGVTRETAPEAASIEKQHSLFNENTRAPKLRPVLGITTSVDSNQCKKNQRALSTSNPTVDDYEIQQNSERK